MRQVDLQRWVETAQRLGGILPVENLFQPVAGDSGRIVSLLGQNRVPGPGFPDSPQCLGLGRDFRNQTMPDPFLVDGVNQTDEIGEQLGALQEWLASCSAFEFAKDSRDPKIRPEMVGLDPKHFPIAAGGGFELAVFFGPRTAHKPDARMPVGLARQLFAPFVDGALRRSLDEQFSQERLGFEIARPGAHNLPQQFYRRRPVVLRLRDFGTNQQRPQIVGNGSQRLVDRRGVGDEHFVVTEEDQVLHRKSLKFH